MKKKIIFSRLAGIFSRLSRISGVRSYNHRILFGLILIIFLSLTACRTQRTIVTTPELHTIHTNTNNTELLWRDRYRYIQTIGDTVHVTDSIFVILYKDSVRTVLQRDSVPYCKPTDIAEIRDREYPQKNGSFYVVATDTEISAAGGRRKVILGRKMSS